MAAVDEVNEEGIFGTRPRHVFGEGPTNSRGGMFNERSLEYTAEDMRFTTKDGGLYVYLLAKPDGCDYGQIARRRSEAYKARRRRETTRLRRDAPLEANGHGTGDRKADENARSECRGVQGKLQVIVAIAAIGPSTYRFGCCMNDPDVARVKEVFEQWAMYDAVVRGDYMRHAELAQALGEWAADYRTAASIVDLGCSDAWLASHAFRTANVEHYVGVDLAESSIERARRNLAIWPGQAELVCGNLADVLAKLPTASANVVLASYSLHHFSTADKLKLVGEIRRLLVKGGAFLWIDAVRDDDESRDAYIDRLTHVMSHDWIGLTVEQRERGVTHVRTSDYPETKSWMLEHVEAAGFRPDATFLEDEFFDGWAFLKP